MELGSHLTVDAVAPRGPAAARGVGLGMRLVACGDVSTLGTPLDAVAGLLAHAGLPMQLTFESMGGPEHTGRTLFQLVDQIKTDVSNRHRPASPPRPPGPPRSRRTADPGARRSSAWMRSSASPTLSTRPAPSCTFRARGRCTSRCCRWPCSSASSWTDPGPTSAPAGAFLSAVVIVCEEKSLFSPKSIFRQNRCWASKTKAGNNGLPTRR